MILIDLNQIVISNLMAHRAMTKHPTPKEGLIRHMVLNSLRAYKTKFGHKYGELVICCDDRDYWRKKIFPFYKQNRKKAQKDSTHDWNEIFNALNLIKSELKEYFPYKVLQVDHAEADDIIGAICYEYGTTSTQAMPFGLTDVNEPIIIVSGDKDLTQLQKFDNVENYSPMTKKFITIINPAKSLKEHILRGDRSDGIPNFLSKDTSFMRGSRQTPIRTKKVRRNISQK